MRKIVLKARRQLSKLEGMRWIRNSGTMADKSNRLVDCVKEFVDVFGADLQNQSCGKLANATSAQKCKILSYKDMLMLLRN